MKESVEGNKGKSQRVKSQRVSLLQERGKLKKIEEIQMKKRKRLTVN
jgi:hypothetical protein